MLADQNVNVSVQKLLVVIFTSRIVLTAIVMVELEEQSLFNTSELHCVKINSRYHVDFFVGHYILISGMNTLITGRFII